MTSLIAAVSLSLLATPIAPPVSDDPVAVNLDRDPQMERLLYHERRPDQLVQAQVRDRCGDTMRTWPLSPYENKFNAIEAVEADGTTPQLEAFFFATGDSGALTDRLVKLVRFDQADGACARPRVLFRYRPRPARNGPGTTVIATKLADTHPSRPGLELRLTLATFARTDGEPHLVRRATRTYAYRPSADRYVRVPD